MTTLVTTGDLRRLAHDILALNCEEKNHVHAEAMLQCSEAEYSRAFYEFAMRCADGLASGYSLSDMVVMLARQIPHIEDLDVDIRWDDDGVIQLTHTELCNMAELVVKLAPNSPDAELAGRLLSRKTTAEDRRHFALRCVDYTTRMADCNKFLVLFCADHERNIRELAALRICINKAMQIGDSYGLYRPQFRPWNDVDTWSSPLECRGFGKGFVPDFEKQIHPSMPLYKALVDVKNKGPIDKSVIDIIDDDKGRSTNKDDVVNSDYEEEMEVADSDPNVLSDEEHGMENGDDTSHLLQLALCSAGNQQNLPTVQPLIASQTTVGHVPNDDSKVADGVRGVPIMKQNETPLPVNEKSDASKMKGKAMEEDPSKKNAWNTKSKKIFQNGKCGGKLHFIPPNPSLHMKVNLDNVRSKYDTWGWALLGHYVGFTPNHFMLNNVIRSWGVHARYTMEEGWIIFRFGSEEDMDSVLKGSPYYIYNKPLIVKRMPDYFAFNREAIATIPVWVRIYGMANQFWKDSLLSEAASYIGTPLFKDQVTELGTKSRYARIMVEVNFAKPITRHITLDYDNGGCAEVEFKIENEPTYCIDCFAFGHVSTGCTFRENSKANGRFQKGTSTELSPSATDFEATTKGAAPKDAEGKLGGIPDGVPKVGVSKRDDVRAVEVDGNKGTEKGDRSTWVRWRQKQKKQKQNQEWIKRAQKEVIRQVVGPYIEMINAKQPTQLDTATKEGKDDIAPTREDDTSVEKVAEMDKLGIQVDALVQMVGYTKAMELQTAGKEKCLLYSEDGNYDHTDLTDFKDVKTRRKDGKKESQSDLKAQAKREKVLQHDTILSSRGKGGGTKPSS